MAKVGFPAILNCQATDSGALIRWAHNQLSIAITNDDPCDCQILPNNSLMIRSVVPSHEGTYTCFIFPGAKKVEGSIVVAGKWFNNLYQCNVISLQLIQESHW